MEALPADSELTISTRILQPVARCVSVLIVLLLALPSVANSSSTPLLVWAQDSKSTPEYSTWSGTSWSGVSNSVDVGCSITFISGANCPTRDEIGFIALDWCNDLNLFGRIGTTWTPAFELTDNGGGTGSRMFDLAYEQSSGDALIVYWEKNDNKLYYRTSNGASLSGESVVSNLVSGDVRWVRLRSRAGSNEIVAAWLDSTNHVYAKVWNGSSWGSETTLTSNAKSTAQECFDVAYESLSGDAMVAYCDDNSTSPRYRMWNGASWSSEGAMSDVGAYGYYLRLAPDPASDAILCAVQDQNNDLNVQHWNGSSWSGVSELETSLNRNNMRQFDLSYANGGSQALIVYASDWSNNFRYRTWNGSSWSSEYSDINVGDDQIVIQLVPGASTGQIFVQMTTDSANLRALVWDGSAFGSQATLETSMSGWSYEPFATIIPAAAVTPADVPYFTDFESTVGAEWNTSTTEYDADFSRFLGRFNGHVVELSLNTTVGETYQLKFDLYAIDSWSPKSWDPSIDALFIKIAGGTIFQESFSQRPSSYPPTYENPPDVIGELGFGTRSGIDTDGIYRNVTVTFTATASVTTLEFTDGLEEGGNSDVNDESYGIDNLSVTTSRFRDVSIAKGFNVQSTTDQEYASGIHWADFDNDGDLDAILGGDSSSRQMTNNSQGASFTASTFGSGNERRGGALFDVDNDGAIDFWSGNHSSFNVETCFQNKGNGTFNDAGNLSFAGPNNNEGVAAADVNRDGWCDIVHFSENGNWIGEHKGDPGKSALLLGETKSSSLGLNDSGDVGNGDYCSSGDVNNDGFLDFFYHYGSGKLFASNGDGTFTENARGISVVTGGSDKMGSAWGDYDNDGDLDLYVSRYASGNTGYLWRNDVTWSPAISGSFTNQTANAYINDETGQRGCAWGDYDNDGDLDLYVVTRTGPNRLYQNQNDGTFRLVDEGADSDGNGHDAVFVDYDNDGDLDICYTREDTTNVLLENRTNDSNYLKVRLLGLGGGGTNVAAVGVRVELWNAAGTVRLGRRDIGVARGFGGTEPMWAHFGGVDVFTTYTLKVWFHSRDNSDPLVVSVVPKTAYTTINKQTISQMITVQESEVRKKILFWREVPNRS
ncbi:MAG: VCBS repeat-containing protein [Phycisphaerales bacterium]|nr:VCBS repeat-containing protein [Phycisphaerales bacterium]MCB9864602.1 VCBS repeat-containing protein [Phycisphaerales bacterium]